MSEMTSKERLLCILNKKTPDRVAWAPNLAYWWDFHEDAKEMGEVNFLENIGADCLIRGHYPIESDGSWEDLLLFEDETPNCSVEENFLESTRKQIVYTTPVGKLIAEYTYVDESRTWFLSKHPVETEEEFKILKYYKEDICVRSSYEKYEQKKKEYADRCLMVPLLNRDMKTAFQSMMEYWVGLENLVYALSDFPELVEEVLEAMKRVNKKYVEISAGARAEVYISWEDSSTTMISPALYEKYIAPEINEWCDILHRNGSKYMQHACGTLNNLARIMKQTKIDALESITPPPTGDIQPWEMAEILGDDVVLIGGIEPTRFAGLRNGEFEKYVVNILEKMKNRSFVLSNSDSCPPEVPMENYRIVAGIVEKMEK